MMDTLTYGRAGEPSPEAGIYHCTLCGHGEQFGHGETVPPDHHVGHPWVLVIRGEIAAPE